MKTDGMKLYVDKISRGTRKIFIITGKIIIWRYQKNRMKKPTKM